MIKYTTREEWLTAAMNRIIELCFKPHELRFPPLVKIGCAPLPCKIDPDQPREGQKPLGTYGVFVLPDQALDGTAHIFINTSLGKSDVIEILATIVHELVHVHVWGEGYESVKHGHPFNKIIRDVGLSGKPKSTFAEPGTELYATLQGLVMELGEYPHAPIYPKMKKKRVSEVLTWISPTDEEYSVKCKYSLTEEKGVPRDYNGEPMIAKDPDKHAELQDRTEEEIEEQESEKAEEAAQ
jgi:hypothetical protein